MSIDAMKQTFDFLHDLWEMKQTIRSDRHKKVMWELDRAIGKAEKQEPVAWMYEDSTYYAEGQLLKSYGFNTIKKWAEFNAAKGTGVVPLYTAPQQREWVGLTDEDMCAAWAQSKGDVLFRLRPFARAIEAKLREKNAT